MAERAQVKVTAHNTAGVGAQAALGILARALRVGPGSFGFCGTKDKRAITEQYVTVYSVHDVRMAALNRTLRCRGHVDQSPACVRCRDNFACQTASHQVLHLTQLYGTGSMWLFIDGELEMC